MTTTITCTHCTKSRTYTYSTPDALTTDQCPFCSEKNSQPKLSQFVPPVEKKLTTKQLAQWREDNDDFSNEPDYYGNDPY